MKKITILSLAMMFIVAIISSCTHDPQEMPAPDDDNDPPGDTIQVTYSGDVVPILTNNQCLSCHSAASQTGGVDLETFESLLQFVDNGRLMGAINHDPGYYPMPPGGAKINDDDIAIIQKWIDDGTPNN